MRISQSTARRLALQCQGLDGQWGLPGGKEGVMKAIEKLGYVQIDTIAVVQRAHHHTLWCRRPDYAPQMLDHEIDHLLEDQSNLDPRDPRAQLLYLQRMSKSEEEVRDSVREEALLRLK